MTMHLEDLADSTFDPYLSDEAVFGDILDPYARIAGLRAQAPVIEADYRAIIGIPTMPSDAATPHCTVLSFAGVDQILNDPVLLSRVHSQIEEQRLTALSALQVVMQGYAAQFARIEQDYFRERLNDVRDVISRVGSHLTRKKPATSNGAPGSQDGEGRWTRRQGHRRHRRRDAALLPHQGDREGRRQRSRGGALHQRAPGR
jgi:hypothetical protein